MNIFHVTSSGGSTTEGYSISIPCTIRSSNGSDISFGTISLYGDTVIDNVSLTSSAPNNNHGDGSDRGIFANGHRLILGTGIGTGAASFKSAPQVFGGGTSSVEDAVETRKSIVSADAELSRTVDLGTFVIVHSGTYYNIVGGGANSDIGSERLPLSTYVVLKGGMSLDTVVGGSGAGGSVYGSAVHTWENGPDQGGTYIYSTGFRMPGDSYHESKVGTDYIPDGMWLEESTIMEGGVSGRDSNNYSDPTYVYGSTHIFLSGDTDIWDVQAGSRRAFSHVEFAYLEISGNAVVRHVACGTITDGNRQSSSQSSPMPVTSVDATKIVVTGNAWVASVFGAGYDTWYLPEATTMAEGERIDVQIKGGTVGSVYGGGYRGTITVGGPDDTRVDDGVFVEISGGTVLGDVYGGGRGGLDKVTHSSGGGINSEGYRDSTGHSVVIGDVFVIVSGGTVKGSVYGGGESVPKLSSYSGVNATFSASDPDMAAVDGDTNVLVNGGTVEGSVYGGGKGVLMHNGQPYDAPMEVPAIVGTAGSYSYQDILWKSGGGAVYDSSVDYTGYARVTGSTAVVIMGGTVKGDIYGGAEIGRVNATANVQVLGHYPVSIQGSVYGGGEGHNQYPALGAVSNTSVRIADAEVTGSVYGGGAYGMVMSIDGVRGTADVDVEASVVHGDVYGGGQGVEAIADSGRVGTVVLDISKGSTVDGSVYGGGQYGASDTIGVTVTGSTVGGSIYGGGLGTASRTSVFGNVALTVDSTTVTGNIYGGSAYGLVEGNIAVELRGGTAATTVYGGGLGTTGNLSAKGNRTVRLEGATVTGSVYGGSQNGNDGAADPDGYTFVVILSAEIGGSVFGGGYRGITWDHTYVYIGCTESETPHEGTVTIGQSVYGGGDVGDVSVGDALFDTTLVYGNSELIVDGSSCTINFNGSLFGEGNSCLTEGDTTIHITDASLRMMSVQRADAVCITSSEIHLEGRNSGTSSSASEKFSFYSVGRLDLVGGTQIYLSSPLGETGDFHSLATPSVPTTQTAPLNTVYVEVGTIFSLQNSEGFGKVYGYTVLSLLASETYYGAFAYGSVDSVGGFVTDDEGLYRTLQYSDLSSPECRYWYIPGVVSQTGSAVLKYDPDIGEGALVSDELKLDIPMTSSGTSLLYGGGYFTSATADAFRLVSGDPTEYGSLSVLMGYAGEGLTSFNNGTGLYVPDRSSETTYVVLEDAGGPDSPRIGVKVSGINPMLSGYAGTVTIQFREVMVADSPEGETNYVYFNAIDVSIAIYIEGHDHPHEGSSTIDIIAGSGQSSFVIPALGDEGDLYVTDARFNGGSLEGAPALTIAGVNNHEGSMGWTGGGFEHVLTVGSESAYLGKFTGMFPSTIQFSMEGFEGTDCSFAIDFEVRVTNGETYQFTMTVKVVTHGPVTVTFVDSRQNVSIPMQFGYGTTITASDGPQVMGNFIGWYNDETFTSQFNFNSPLIRDITLYARYMYTVTFDEMYDGRTSTYYVPMGEPFTIDNYGGKNPVRPGYEFTRWYKDRDCLVLWDFKNDKVEGDITLYAGWQPRGVILDFHNEDGDVILTLGAGDGERIRLDDLFGPYLEQAVVAFGTVPEGGTLVWYVSVSGTGIPVYADNTIEQSMVTVEGGGWHVKVHADVLYNSITVVQDAQDYGSTVVPPKEFSVGPDGGYYTFTPTGADRVGYELSGWIIEATSQEYAPGVTIKIPASEVSKYLSGDGKLHLVAQWRALTYEVVVMKPAGGSVTATLISSDGSTSSGREHTSYISFSAHYGDRLSLSYVSEGGYTFEGWVVSKAGAIDDASEQSTYMTVRGDSRVEVRVGGLESAVIRLSVDGAAPGGSITLTGDGRTYTVRQSSVDGEYGVFSVSALLGEYSLSYGGSGFGTIAVVSGGVSGSYRLVSLELEVTPDADVGTLPSYAVPGTQLALDIPHGYSVSKLTLRYDDVDHDMGAVSGFTVPSAQSTGVTVKVELETSNYTIEFVVDFTGSDGAKVVFDKVASITVEYSPDGTVYPELPWVQLNGLDLNALDRETTSPYSFLGWYLDEGFMQRVQAGDAFPEEDVVLHASIADRKEIIYVVKVYMMGIGGGYPDTPTYEIQTIELENQYVGWRPDYPGFAVESSDYENTVVEAGMGDLCIRMVRASGTAVLDPAGGTVSESGGWTLNGEGELKGKLTRKIWYGETVTLPVPVKTENVFGGWSVDDSTVTQVTVGDGMLDQAYNTVFFKGTAQWTVNEYRLVLSTLYGTFSNGQTTMTVSVPYGTHLSDVLNEHRDELEEKAGMYADFGGWIPAPPDTMPADTLTLTAQWTPRKVSITVTGDEHVTISVTGSSLTGSDGSYDSVFNGSIDLMLSFDSGYSLKEATGAKEQPVRKSAVQFEWTVPLNSVNVTVGDDGTLSLTLKVASVESAVTVTYVINGTPAASLFQNVPSGENVVLHNLSGLQGLKFDGWYSGPEMYPEMEIEGNTISFVDADDREVVYGSLTLIADELTGHITAGDLVLDKGVYVGTYNGGRHTLTAVPDTYAEGSTALDYDLTYRIIWDDKVNSTENRTVSFTNAGEYSVTLTVIATLTIGGTVSDVSEALTKEFKIWIKKADAKVEWIHDDAYVYNGADRSGTVYAYYVGVDNSNHQLTVSFPKSFTDVGEYTFTVPEEDSNHIFSNRTLCLSIEKKVLTITQDGSLSYNGQAQSPTFTDDRISGDDICVHIPTDSKTDAGTYPISLAGVQPTGADAWNYELPASVTWTIDRVAAKDLTWKVEDKYTYTGHEVIPEVQAYIGGEKVDMVLDTDYSVAGMQGRNNTDAGIAYVLVECTGNYSGRAEVEFTIAPQEVSLDSVELVYNTQPQTPTFALPKLIDAEVSVSVDPKMDVGDYTATFTITGTGAGNYIPAGAVDGAGTASWSIAPLDITGAAVIVNGDYTYAGGQIEPAGSDVAVKVTVNGAVITLPSGDYTFSATDNVDAGKATLTVSGTGNCTGTATGAFTIDPAQLPTEGWTVTNEHTYTGASHGDDILVSNGGLVQGKDFTVSSDSIDAGDATATITGVGNYTGYADVKFTIEKYVIQVSLERTQFTYNGQIRTVELDTSAVFARDEGYVSFSITGDVSAAAVGSYMVSVVMSAGGSGDRTGNYVLSSETLGWSIVKRSLTFEQNELIYNGEEQSPTFVMSGKVDGEDVDFIVTAVKKTDAGSYTADIEVTGNDAGNYTWPAKVEWSISPMDITAVRQDGTLTYNGGIQSPTFTVPCLISGDTVTVDVTGGTEQATDADAYTAVVRLTGDDASNYHLISAGAEWTIGKLTLQVSLDESEFTYDGTKHTVKPSHDGVLDADAGDVKVTFAGDTSAVNAGDYAVTVSLAGDRSHNYALPSESLDWKISKKTIQVSLVQDEFTYNGNELGVRHTYAGVVDSDRAYVEVSIVSGGTGKDAKDYTAVIGLSGTKAGNYVLSESSKQISWTIAPKEVTPHLEKEGFTYSGESHTVKVIVPGILNDEASVRIEEGGSGTAPGSYTVRFSLEGEGKDNYTLTATELTWSIGKLSLGTALVEITGEYTYTGSEIEPEMTVTVNGLTLAESDYDVSYSDNVNAGLVNVTVTAKDTSFFTGEAHSTFEIKKKAVSVSVSETGFTYDGNEHTVTVKLSETIEGIILVTEGDLKGTAAGSYTVRLSLGGEGSGNYVLDTEGFTWTISKRSLQDADVSLKGDLTYTGSQIRPGATVTIGELVLEEGKDYEVSYGDNRNVSDGGIVRIAAVGNGNFVGEKTIGFNILRKEVDVSLSSNSFVYDGYKKTVTVGYEGIVDNGVSVVPVDGSILSATQAGTYTVNLSLSGEGSGNYRLSENSLTWTIGKLNLGGSGADIDIDGDFVYCASQIRPVVTVTVGDMVLEEGIDYEVAYGENILAGQGSVTVTALDGGSLAGSRTIGFTIEKRTVHVILGETSFEYSGSEHTVSVSVNRSDILNDEVRLVIEGTLSATDAGTYTVKLSLAGEREDNYVLSIEGFIWVIGGKSISDADVDVSDEMYTGSGIIPDVKVVVDGITLVEDADYTLSYQDNINAGEGYVTITAKGNYEGSITVPFDIARKALGVSLVEDSFVYDGEEHSVVLDHISGIAAGDVVNVSLDGITRATHAGEYHVDVVMTGADSGNYYLQTTALTWIIEKRGLHDATVSLDDGSTYTYTGSQIMPDVTVSVGGLSPVAGADYAVSYFDNINAGIGTVIITATEDGDYEGTVRVNFAISKKVLEPVLSEGSFVYDGEEHTAELGDLSVSIAQGDDLNVYLKGTVSATDAGTYHVEVAMEGSDAGNYSLKATAFTWIIEKADMGSAHVTVPDGLIHTGSAVEPDVLVEFGGMTLVAGRDYTLSYADNYDAGTAYVTVTAVEDGNFEGSLTVGFDIGRAHLDLVDIADLDDAVYHGSAHTPEISAEYNGSELIEGMHYTVEYHDNIEAGTATVALRAVDGSNFTGYRHLTFDISPASVDGFGIDDIDDRVYTGSPIEPGISAVFNGAPLTEWEDYELRYADNTDAGNAIVIIEGRGNFSGVREIGFMIVPASMEDVSIAPVPDQMYTGAEVRPGITATLNGVPLVEGEDYILSYVGDTVNVTGDCVYVVAEGIGNLTGTVSIPYRIVYDGLQDITGITVNGYTGVYDGSEHIAVTVIGTMQGDKVSYSTDGTTFVSEVPTVTHVSESCVVWVKVERPGCVPTMFGVSVTVAPAGLTVESSSVQGMYDGEPLTGHEVTVVNGQLFGDDGFIWVFTGQQIAPGSSANTFVPAALPGTEAGDYIITLVYGTLTVDQSAISESSSWVLAFILAIGIAAASYHGIMWVSGGRPLEALSALVSRLASAIRRE